MCMENMQITIKVYLYRLYLQSASNHVKENIVWIHTQVILEVVKSMSRKNMFKV